MRKKLFPTLFLVMGYVTATNAQTLQSVTTTGNYTTNRVVIGSSTDDGVGNLQVTGKIIYTSPFTNTSTRPLISTSSEFRARSATSLLADDGFMRISAGGGSSSNVKSYIDLSGYSTVDDMKQNIVLGTSGTERMRILSNGNVGIGTVAPDQKLTVSGNISASGSITAGSAILNGNFELGLAHSIGLSLSDQFTYNGKQQPHYGMQWVSDPWNSYGPSCWLASYGGIKLFTGGVQRFSIDANGGVGIGVTNTINTGYKLMVDGTIGSRRVKVTQDTWSDFVFAPDYHLPSLEEVEKYVIENKHLPDVPSAAEVTQNGQDLGEMNKILLQKIEELTLYIIDLKKEVSELKARQ
ncbi:hypothetical protein [Chitinophaga sp.]|uniref:hypothetical protein n=1 Tax=Chitinophaga sp. TaxID=1869181 RepID=UPI0031E4271D